ncbi:hypothetical protein [uncultured Methanobrevibacter sp.]|uniref:hypothetical protein n=1 Tax=uncultured Methanobrevibacter sp. TaxID=253161 RepID=UPI0025FC64CF|nr:hypothetical protein [uncultured Methanobrevibacter sp.]
MKTKKDVQLELLKEVDEISSKKDLNYILTGLNTLNAYRNHTIKKGPISVFVAMTEGDLERFCKIIEEEHEDRYVEGRFNNPNHKETYVFYGNRNTAEFNMLKSDDSLYNGISIQITPISLSKSKKNVARKKVFGRIKSLIRNDEDDKRFLDKWKDMQDYRLVKIINKEYDVDIFKEIEKVNVDGIDLAFPKDNESYFKKMYGKNFNSRKINEKTQPNHILIDANRSYEEVMEEIGDLVIESRNNSNEIKKEREIAIEDYNIIINNWNLVEMTNDSLSLENILKKTLKRY